MLSTVAAGLRLSRQQRLRWDLIIAALTLFCCSALSRDTPRTPETPTATEVKSDASIAEPAGAAHAKPDAPTPKPNLAFKMESESGSGGEAITPGSSSILSAPVKPAIAESYDTPRKRKIWYTLMVANHGAAAFDAWTTRRAISGGYGLEGDPLQRPFANSGALYATTQVAPLLTDYLGRRMMRSRNSWIRHSWWVPQVACASVSFSAGVHNYRVVP